MGKFSFLLICFTLLTVIMTFPLIFRMNTVILGTFDTTEVFGTVWWLWGLKYSFIKNLDLQNYHFIAYPFEQPLIVLFSFPVGVFITKWSCILTNEIFFYNSKILLSFLLSGLFNFMLVQFLTSSWLSAIFSGIIYAFCPYHFARTWQHLGLAEIQWMPLYFFALFKMIKEKKFINALFVAFTFYLFSENYIYVYCMIIATLVLAIFILLNSQQRHKWQIFRLLVVSGILTFFLTLPATYVLYKNLLIGPSKEVLNLYHRPLRDLFEQSARPLSYLLPSAFHPVFGQITQLFIGSGYYGKSLTEHTLYLGWLPLIFSLVALRRYRQLSKLRNPLVEEKFEERFYIGFFILLAVVAWFFSQPPWWRMGPIRIFMPAYFMYQILPQYRAYCRFGIVVMLAISVLAGFGLKFILERFSRHSGIPQNAGKTQKSKIAITFIFCSLVLFEFWNYPPFRVIDLTKYPKVYDWLAQQPEEVVIAEYPLDLNGPNELYRFYQTKHHKRMINATIPDTYANRISSALENISDYKTAAGLSWLGVKYVLIHRSWYMDDENIKNQENLVMLRKNNGLRFVNQIDDVEIFQVIAPPVKPNVK